MKKEMERLRDEVATAVAALQPDAYSPAEADGVLAACTAIADLVEGAALLLSARAVSGETMRAAKERLARRSGCSEGDAERTITCSRALDALPVVADALRAGRLSRVQAREVIDAAKASPGSQGDLVAAAGSQDLKGLRDLCGRVKAAADRDPEATRRRQHAGRFVRTWTAADGSRRGSWSMAPEAAAEVESALAAYTDKIFRQAYRAGHREPLDAYRADALVAMARHTTRHPGSPPAHAGGPARPPTTATATGTPRKTGTDFDGARSDTSATASAGTGTDTYDARSDTDPSAVTGTEGGATVDGQMLGVASSEPGRRPDSTGPPGPVEVSLDDLPVPIARELVVVIDLATLSATLAHLDPRRAPMPGEAMCELRGIGPVAASVAAEWLGNSFLKVVLTDGDEVQLVKHVGRHVPASLLTAIRYLHPTCSTPGCGRGYRLENDHLHPHTLGGPVSLANIEPKCDRCHDAKTRDDMKKIRAARAGGEPVPSHAVDGTPVLEASPA